MTDEIEAFTSGGSEVDGNPLGDPTQGIPRPKRAQERIQELNGRAKLAEERFERMAQMHTEILGELRESRKVQSQPKSTGAFSNYQDDQLWALHSDLIDPKSENHNPSQATLVMREVIKRERESARSEFDQAQNTRNTLAQRKAQTINEALALLGDDASDFAKPGTPQYQLVLSEYQDQVRRLGGEGVLEQNPELYRGVILAAHAKWSQSNRTGSQDADRLRRKMGAQAAVSSGAENDIDQRASVRSLFAQGKVDEGMQKLGPVQNMIASLKAGMPSR